MSPVAPLMSTRMHPSGAKRCPAHAAAAAVFVRPGRAIILLPAVTPATKPEDQLDLFSRSQLEPSPAEVRPDVLRAQAEQLARRLTRLLGMDVRLAITDNRSTVISYRRRPGALALRVHHMFLHAPAPVVQALADYAGRGKKHAGQELDRYIKAQRHRLRPPRASSALKARGLFHDLQALYDRLNADHFGGQVDARIGWGRVTARRNQRSIRMGVYLHEERVIRIHPALDRPEVPEFFVAFVVFHEMLHQAVPAAHCGDGRRQHHGAEFRARERSYPEYAQAIAWEKAHLDLLLGTRRAGEAA
jgi:hypothetical protein